MTKATFTISHKFASSQIGDFVIDPARWDADRGLYGECLLDESEGWLISMKVRTVSNGEVSLIPIAYTEDEQLFDTPGAAMRFILDGYAEESAMRSNYGDNIYMLDPYTDTED